MGYRSSGSTIISNSNTTQYWPPSPVLLNGGLNLVDREWKLNNNQTSDVLNRWFYQGKVSKRWGQEWVNSDLGSVVYSSYKYKYLGFIMFQCGTKLYKLSTSTGTTTEIYSGLNAVKGAWFKFNNKLYFIQPGKYIQYDGTTASPVVPYIPTVIINRTPTGGGNTNEGYNRLGAGFKNSFNGNGSATVYTLTDSGLDATTVTCTIGGVVKTEGTDFTVNRTTGTVTFSVAPTTGQNNVIITAYKTVQEDIDSILNCLHAVAFGGQNDNRVFFAGNGTGYFYWTGITTAGIDASYFEYNNYNIIGLTDENITGFGKHKGILCIFKAREIYGETYSWDGTKGIFNTFTIDSSVGCDCPDTIQNIVNDNLIWLNTYSGPYILVSSENQNESQRNVYPIGRNINPRLLNETNLATATSVRFNDKYWLCVNDKVYLMDYGIAPYIESSNPDESAKALSWWIFDNINASCWIPDGQDLYYGSREIGRIAKFHTTYDNLQFYDFGESFNDKYRIPLRDFGNSIYEFNVPDVWIDVDGDRRTDIQVKYITSDEINGEIETEPITVGSFSLINFSLLNFTLRVMGFRTTFHLKPMEKKIDLFGIELSGSDGGRDSGISNIVIGYTLGRRKK